MPRQTTAGPKHRNPRRPTEQEKLQKTIRTVSAAGTTPVTAEGLQGTNVMLDGQIETAVRTIQHIAAFHKFSEADVIAEIQRRIGPRAYPKRDRSEFLTPD